VSLDVAIERTTEVQRLLGERVPAASIGAGHAELRPTDTLDSVIARADAELPRQGTPSHLMASVRRVEDQLI
jgi:hypothetical protein